MSSKYCRHVSTQKPLAAELTKRIRFCASSQILSTVTPTSVGKVKLFLDIILFNVVFEEQKHNVLRYITIENVFLFM